MFNALYAQAQGGASGAQGSWVSLVPIILMIVIFYFLLIRPQQKKEKDRKTMIEGLKNGDRVLTVGGMHAVVSAIKDEQTITLKIGDKMTVDFSKNAIQAKL